MYRQKIFHYFYISDDFYESYDVHSAVEFLGGVTEITLSTIPTS